MVGQDDDNDDDVVVMGWHIVSTISFFGCWVSFVCCFVFVSTLGEMDGRQLCYFL